jgi:hypothetical protein
VRYYILPYRQGSRSARALAQALGGRVLRLQGSNFLPKKDDLIINWGATERPSKLSIWPMLNPTQDMKAATNKLTFFQTMKERGNEQIIPDFWTSPDDIPDTAFPIVCRTVLAGHSGDGIVIAPTRADLVRCSLYVSYVKKQDEYRIHCGRKDKSITVVSVQRKARRLETPDADVNWQVRNLAGGFVYTRQGVSPPNEVLVSATKALEASGLDFGAVDVIYNREKKRAYVLEINTAPGLEGQTVEDYAAYFRR